MIRDLQSLALPLGYVVEKDNKKPAPEIPAQAESASASPDPCDTLRGSVDVAFCQGYLVPRVKAHNLRVV